MVLGDLKNLQRKRALSPISSATSALRAKDRVAGLLNPAAGDARALPHAFPMDPLDWPTEPKAGRGLGYMDCQALHDIWKKDAIICIYCKTYSVLQVRPICSHGCNGEIQLRSDVSRHDARVPEVAISNGLSLGDGLRQSQKKRGRGSASSPCLR